MKAEATILEGGDAGGERCACQDLELQNLVSEASTPPNFSITITSYP